MARRRELFALAIEKAKNGKHWQRPEAVAVIETLRDSGLSIPDFLRQHQLPEKRVRWWNKRLDDLHPRKVETPQFVEVRVIEAEERSLPLEQDSWIPAVEGPSPLEVILHNGRAVRVSRGFDAVTLARVVEVLEVTPC